MEKQKNTNVKKLYRSRTEKQVAGVCGGLAAYFNIDVTLIRILFVIATLAGGPGILLYILLAIVIPTEPRLYGED
ncbi:PspC domain-containing protein [Anaerolineales bacterium]